MTKTVADVYNYINTVESSNTKLLPILIFIPFIQMIFAGLMAGMKAGLYFPSWPDMNGSFIPEVLMNMTYWTWLNLTNYDTYIFAPALINSLTVY